MDKCKGALELTRETEYILSELKHLDENQLIYLQNNNTIVTQIDNKWRSWTSKWLQLVL